MNRWPIACVPAIVALLACSTDAAHHETAPDADVVAAPAKAKEEAATLSEPPEPERLRVYSYGIAGFLLEHHGEAVLTAPFFTRASLVDVFVGNPVTSDAALVAQKFHPAHAAKLRAVVTGHAHYDHLLDVPAILGRAPRAKLFANRSAQKLLGAYAPDRPAHCPSSPAPAMPIARERVVALDDPDASTVDYTNCPTKRPPNAPLEGRWVRVPDAHVRVLAVCSEHPDQFGSIHFGEGDVEQEPCTPPKKMDEWREGTTLAFLIDFLDPVTDAPAYRVYYQDSPTNRPIGHIPPAFLSEKRVDLALLCVGSYKAVDGGTPAKMITSLAPRYALGGHWEDFFIAADAPLRPLPFTDPNDWKTKAVPAVAATPETKMLVRNGTPIRDRAVIPQPADTFEIMH
jgi:glyoxylase-like metal-dependent hydrolase (beta-lactamase superfamily II)